MSYLQNKRLRKKHTQKVIIALAVIFVLVYFNTNIFKGLSVAVHTIFRPVVIFGNNIGRNLNNNLAYFQSKKKLKQENEELSAKVTEFEAEISNYNTILEENLTLKDTLGRKRENELILGGIISKPNKSPYDTLIIDVGLYHGVATGDMVFALGDVPLGRVDQVFEKSSKVVMYSSPGEKLEIILGSRQVFLEAIGRGGGNFEVTIPRDMEIIPGTEATIPGAFPYTLARVETIISDPRDSFAKALLVSPINITELKFVQVLK